jgi:hypothetical protein
LGYFFHGKSNVVIFTKNIFGYILGDFFTNASGHPDLNPKILASTADKEIGGLNKRDTGAALLAHSGQIQLVLLDEAQLVIFHFSEWF